MTTQFNLPDSLNDPAFWFDRRWHSYKHGVRRLTSVSKWYKSFKSDFDKEGVSARVAEKEGITVEEVLAQWEAKAKRSIELGLLVHKAIEYHFKGGDIPGDLFNDEEALKRFTMFQMLLDSRLKGAKCLGTELHVFSLKLGIAGAIDILIMLNRKVYIIDVKTNEKFRLGESGFEQLKPPFDHLKDNEMNQAALQLGLLRILLESHGVVVAGISVVHLPPAPAVEAVVHFPPDLRKEILACISPTEPF